MKYTKVMKYCSFAILCLVLFASKALAQSSVTWTAPETFDTGERSSVAMLTSGLVVEFHRSESTYSAAMWYRIGHLTQHNTIVWRRSHPVGVYGSWPSVAFIGNGTLIFAYSDGAAKSGSKLHYWIGQLDPWDTRDQEITWLLTDVKYDAGFHPSVVVTERNVIVEAHESDGGKGIYYRIGHLENPRAMKYNVIWDSGDKGVKYDDGINPHISVNIHNEILETHQVPGEKLLHYIRGTLRTAGIDFQEKHPRYDDYAEQPAVALLPNGLALELDVSRARTQARTGRLNRTDAWKVDWNSADRFNDKTGSYPAITATERHALATWQGGNDLYYTVGTIH